MKIFEKHVNEFILGRGYVQQTPVLMTQDEVWAEIEKQGGQTYQNVHYEEVDAPKLLATIANLTAFNESMQTDARKNTETIRELKRIAANLAKHLEAINNIAERDMNIIPKIAKEIRKHCEAANVMEAL